MTTIVKTETHRLALRAAGATDIGRVRTRNEDAQLVDLASGLFVVADGVGGYGYGDVASKMVVDRLPEIIRRRVAASTKPRTDADAAIPGILGKSVSELSRYIHAWGKEVENSGGMGTTVVVALVTQCHVHIAHMGDSRAYLLRGRELRQLTYDHSLVGLLLQDGEITAEEAEHHPARNYLMRYLGMDNGMEPDTQTIALQPEDRLLLCSDGLWGMVPKPALTRILEDRKDPETTCQDLLAAGNAGGGLDNLTAVVVDFFAD